MKSEKRSKLKRQGWEIGDAKDFLELSEEETVFIELKLALSSCLRRLRQKRRLTQNQLADLLESSQSRVAKMEAGDPSVTVDLLLRALLRLGTTKKELVKIFGKSRAA